MYIIYVQQITNREDMMKIQYTELFAQKHHQINLNVSVNITICGEQ